MEECIQQLLETEGRAGFGKCYDAVVEALRSFSWNDTLDPPMFDACRPVTSHGPHTVPLCIKCQLFASPAYLQALIPPVDFDFECRIVVRLEPYYRSGLNSFGAYVWSESERAKLERPTSDGYPITRAIGAFIDSEGTPFNPKDVHHEVEQATSR
eukprot:4403434-Prymnesium_polylepis.2